MARGEQPHRKEPARSPKTPARNSSGEEFGGDGERVSAWEYFALREF